MYFYKESDRALTLFLKNSNKWSSKSVVPPIVLATTYKLDEVEIPRFSKENYFYSRYGNPTRDAFEDAIAHAENGKFAFSFSSGMAAISTVFNATLKAGEHWKDSKQFMLNNFNSYPLGEKSGPTVTA